jgi:hypothetical protein
VKVPHALCGTLQSTLGRIPFIARDTQGSRLFLRIVVELVHDLLDKGYCLYLDNWYTSPKLRDTLCTRKTDLVETMRTHRKEIKNSINGREWYAHFCSLNKLLIVQIKGLICEGCISSGLRMSVNFLWVCECSILLVNSVYE